MAYLSENGDLSAQGGEGGATYLRAERDLHPEHVVDDRLQVLHA